MFQKNQKSIFCIIRSPAVDESTTIIVVNIHSDVLFFNKFDDNLLKILMHCQFCGTKQQKSFFPSLEISIFRYYITSNYSLLTRTAKEDQKHHPQGCVCPFCRTVFFNRRRKAGEGFLLRCSGRPDLWRQIPHTELPRMWASRGKILRWKIAISYNNCW